MTPNSSTFDFNVYLRPDHQVRIGFHLPDDTAIDLNAIVIGIDGAILHLETYGSEVDHLIHVPIGTKVVILSSESWAFCRFQGILDDAVGRDFTVRLEGEPEIQQRREYFRMDVFLPLDYSMPEDQQLSSVEGIWKAQRMMDGFGDPPRAIPFQESFKILKWNDGPDIEPSRMNISGGGLRVKTPEAFTSGTLLNMDLFLPMNQIRVISAVASVIRSVEIKLTLDNRLAFTTAMKFAFITEKDQEKIISHIFNEQRNNLRTLKEK
jgi:Family of unknown function (DUF5634) N-terminal domain/PilZ domain